MGKIRANKKENKGVIQFMIAAKKLKKKLAMVKKFNNGEFEDMNVPKDVKEGHFAVIAVDERDEPKRFIVPLNYLSHPTFLKLLELAAEEYGFDHEGALAIPCRPHQLETIFTGENWG